MMMRSFLGRGGLAIAGACLLAGLGAGVASAAPDHCVSTNGTVRVQQGTATCYSEAGRGNVAVAHGPNTYAAAGDEPGDEHNRARVQGADSTAVSGNGDNNSATAQGTDTGARAGNGSNNTAVARTDGCRADAQGQGTRTRC
ncbi:hypothetical protein PHK61_20505 [Actinomycetospora lutea]|uniref:hypothetical protein n=1 Tax=Actinomycetospora lutea TaxID=663604 RepID=UPI002365804C|nr:hypothetical protein [Actinomycetospora lutea]MDD7940807.1 hypothetical protein [Actinomycetospora lutea]